MLGEVLYCSLRCNQSYFFLFFFFFFFFPVCLFLQKPANILCFPISFFLHKMSYTVSVFHLAIYSRNHSISVNKSLSHSILQQHLFTPLYVYNRGFPGDSEDKASACNAGDPGTIPGLGRSPGEGNGNPLQYPCLENPMDRGAWRATVHGVTKSRKRLSKQVYLESVSYV